MAVLLDGIRWFKASFGDLIAKELADTAFNLNFLTAIATQETAEVWLKVFQTLPQSRVLQICVGDTIDAPGRTVFPANKEALLAILGGNRFFQVARAALEDVGQFNPEYGAIAKSRPDKFCHGFGIFQYDIQFCRPAADPDFFLQRQWYDFGACLSKCLEELRAAQTAAKLSNLNALNDLQCAYVAIAYNTGHFDPAKGLKQGYYDKSSSKYYGELIYQYIEAASRVPHN